MSEDTPQTEYRQFDSEADFQAAVDRLLEEATRRFAGNEWVAAVLEAMKSIADTRERARMMKESMYSSGKLRSRLAARGEAVMFCLGAEAQMPSYLRRKPEQGKGGPQGPAA